MKALEEQDDLLKVYSVLWVILQQKLLKFFLQLVQIKKNYFKRKFPRVRKHI